MCKNCNRKHLNNNRMDVCMECVCYLINEKTNYETLASCCGHGKYPMTVIVSDKRGRILEYFSQLTIPRKRNFYKRDEHGIFFVPEVKDFWRKKK